MRNPVQLFFAGLLFSTALMFPESATEARTWKVDLVAISSELPPVVNLSSTWENCGSYLAVANTPDGRMVRYSYYGGTMENPWQTRVDAIPVEWLTVAINGNELSPVMEVDDVAETITIWMNIVDSIVANPCRLAQRGKV